MLFDQVPPVQLEILHLMIKLICVELRDFLPQSVKVTLFIQLNHTAYSHIRKVLDSVNILTDDFILVLASLLIQSFPPFTNHVVVEILIISLVFFDELAREIIYLKIGEGRRQVDHTAGDRIQRQPDLFIFEAVLAEEGHRNRTIRAIHSFVVALFHRLLVLVVDREID